MVKMIQPNFIGQLLVKLSLLWFSRKMFKGVLIRSGAAFLRAHTVSVDMYAFWFEEKWGIFIGWIRLSFFEVHRDATDRLLKHSPKVIIVEVECSTTRKT